VRGLDYGLGAAGAGGEISQKMGGRGLVSKAWTTWGTSSLASPRLAAVMVQNFRKSRRDTRCVGPLRRSFL